MERETKENCYSRAGHFLLHDQHFHRDTCLSTDDYHKGKTAGSSYLRLHKTKVKSEIMEKVEHYSSLSERVRALFCAPKTGQQGTDLVHKTEMPEAKPRALGELQRSSRCTQNPKLQQALITANRP